MNMGLLDFQDTCEQCNEPSGGLQPYGTNGEWICITCGAEDAERVSTIVVDNIAKAIGQTFTKVSHPQFYDEAAQNLRIKGIEHLLARQEYKARLN
tara:strand:+ start:3303 stop:3590 length:288 start_codon:yes stop_codon:yes gene_type:complete